MAENEKNDLKLGKVTTVKNYYGLHLTLDTKEMSEQRDMVEAENKVDVFIKLDGKEYQMSFEDFKKRITTNKRG
jgi:hypothetical protein